MMHPASLPLMLVQETKTAGSDDPLSPTCLPCSALLLEMYTRDGTPGVCMIAADLYEGIR